MFRIKICGLTDPDDAQAAAELGADAIGVNFYDRSPRTVSVDRAIEIVHEENLAAQRVGVFVNHDADEVNRVAKLAGLAWVQLHGNERPLMLAKISPHVKIIRVYRIDDDEDPEPIVTDDLAKCEDAGRKPDAVLVDSAAAGALGGTGMTADWSGWVDHRNFLGGIPLILAGGLKTENVADAIALVQPDAVDVASGVEDGVAGRKSRVKMQAFIEAAQDGFADLKA